MRTSGQYQAWKPELILIFLFMEDSKPDLPQKQKRETIQHPWKLEKARNFIEVKYTRQIKRYFPVTKPFSFLWEVRFSVHVYLLY